ncbi:actin family [Radiomyces spectabilis]|uniref:actin family n=1 Tax=Radiomyces spectabilis TaxID=64574 RepID=UPI00221E4CCD|nr:actin family [Radiomyces spectabilis]KAI8372732.1 actin family [Radiomyces spectabilis]
MVTYGGDEVNALVMDVGSTTTRAGYAGEDTPKAVFPTCYGYLEEPDVDPSSQTKPTDGDITMTEAAASESSDPRVKKSYFIGDTKINTWRANMEVKNPMEDGLVTDWDAMEQIWNATFHSMMRVNPTEHPLLCTEPAWNTTDKREKLVELAFEKFDFPAFYLAKDAVMTAFSVGRATALVLDAGGSLTSAVPVYDGYVLKKGILRQPIGGDLLTREILQQLKTEYQYDVTPHYKIASKKHVDSGQAPEVQLRDRPGTTQSYHDYQVSRVIHEYKESVCQVSEVSFDEGIVASRPQKPFEFPDGYNNSFGVERYRLPEILYQPKNFVQIPQQTEDLGDNVKIPSVGLTQQQIDNSLGMHQLVYNSICNCDIDLRPLLFNNVVVTGGSTLFPGFNERLNYELPMMAPGSKIKIHAAGNQMERKCSSWLGGSILASLGTFHQLWISKKEYEEVGASIVETKCQ